MASVDELTQEKQRIAERLARLDAERAKLADQLNELEIAERVLSRFGKGNASGAPARRGRPAKSAATSPNAAPALGARPRDGARTGPSTQPASGLSLSDAALKAIEAHGEGATAAEVLSYLSRELGMAVRPNHLGIALQRHRRAGRLESRDGRWHLPLSVRGGLEQPAMTG